MSLTVPVAADGHIADLVQPGARPHETYAGAFLAGYRNAKTREAYEVSLRQWFTFCDKNRVDPLRVVRAHVELFARELEALGRKPRTVCLRLVAISAFYEYLVDEDVLTKNPTRRVKRPKVDRASPTAWLTGRQVFDLLTAAEQLGPHKYALLCLLALNGLRIAEACSLNVESVASDGFYATLHFTRKGGGAGSAVLSRPVEAAVQAAIGGRSEGPLLLTEAGTRMNQKAAQRAIDRIIDQVRGKHGRVTNHALRHSWTTLCLAAGVPVDQVQHDGGWADSRLVAYYSHGKDAPLRASTHMATAFVFGTS